MRCHLHDVMQHLDLVFYGNLAYEEYLEKLETFGYAVHIVILEFELSYDIENSDGFETVRDFGLRPIRRRFVKGVVRMTGYAKGVRGEGRELREGLRLRVAVDRAALRLGRRSTEPVGIAPYISVSVSYLFCE